MKTIKYIVIALFVVGIASARELKDCIPEKELLSHSFPMSEKNRETWLRFYCCSSEAGSTSILVEAGKALVPDIVSGIRDKKMYARRYAIAALGYLGDASTIDPLQSLLEDSTERDYIRADALEAIYVIDQKRGTNEAKAILESKSQETDGTNFLVYRAKAIIESPEKIDLKWKSNYGPSGIQIESK